MHRKKRKLDFHRIIYIMKGEIDIAMKVVKQQDLKDCGACCLLAIIKYYKGNVSLEKVRLDTHTNLEGTNALNLIEAAQKYGYRRLHI